MIDSCDIYFVLIKTSSFTFFFYWGEIATVVQIKCCKSLVVDLQMQMQCKCNVANYWGWICIRSSNANHWGWICNANFALELQITLGGFATKVQITSFEGVDLQCCYNVATMLLQCSKSLGVKSKLLPREVFLKPHIARPGMPLHPLHSSNAGSLQSN